MKKHSNFRFFIEYIAIAFSIYLIGSLVVALIVDASPRAILCDPQQICAVFMFYWWPPIFRMVDLENHNKECREIEAAARKYAEGLRAGEPHAMQA